MAQRGSFKRMFEKMVQLMGDGRAERLVMFNSNTGNDYILVTPEDAGNMKSIDVDGDLRTVLAPTYRELACILKSRQGEIFEKAEVGGAAARSGKLAAPGAKPLEGENGDTP